MAPHSDDVVSTRTRSRAAAIPTQKLAQSQGQGREDADVLQATKLSTTADVTATVPTRKAAVVPPPHTVSSGPLTVVITAALLGGILVVPLVLTAGETYIAVFPEEWRVNHVVEGEWPHPLGLTLGLLAVAVGMVFSVL